MKPPLRIVIDTNVMVSALLSYDSTPGLAVRLALNQCQLILSSFTHMEIEDVLRRQKIARLLSWDRRQDFIEKLRFTAEFVSIVSKIEVCRDPRDNLFLEVAVDGNASAIVTGDQDLLELDPFRKLRILTPRQFLDVYGPQGTAIKM